MKTWKKTAAALAGIALLGMNTLPALAADGAGDSKDPTAAPEQQVAPYVMGGWATIKELPGQQNDNQMLVSIQNPGEEQPWELVLNMSQQTILLDNQAGTPVTLGELKEGQSVYVYYSTAMTRSLPPQSAAYAVLTNVSEQSAPAKLHVVEQVLDANGAASVMTDHGSLVVSLTEETKFSHLVNKSVVTAQDLQPGTWFFAWYDVVALSYPGQAAAQRVVVLPQQEQEEVEIWVNGQAIEAKAQNKDGVLMVPVRAVAEALGFSVGWDSQARQAVLATDQGQVALTVGQDAYQYTTKVEGAVGLSAPESYGAAPEIQQPGTTWAPVQVFSLLAQQDVVSVVDGALQINVTAK